MTSTNPRAFPFRMVCRLLFATIIFFVVIYCKDAAQASTMKVGPHQSNKRHVREVKGDKPDQLRNANMAVPQLKERREGTPLAPNPPPEFSFDQVKRVVKEQVELQMGKLKSLKRTRRTAYSQDVSALKNQLQELDKKLTSATTTVYELQNTLDYSMSSVHAELTQLRRKVHDCCSQHESPTALLQEHAKELNEQSQNLQAQESQLQNVSSLLQQVNRRLQVNESQTQLQTVQLQQHSNYIQKFTHQFQNISTQLQQQTNQLEKNEKQTQQQETQLVQHTNQLIKHTDQLRTLTNQQLQQGVQLQQHELSLQKLEDETQQSKKRSTEIRKSTWKSDNSGPATRQLAARAGKPDSTARK